MSSFSRFDPAGGLKGTLPGGIFEPLLSTDQRDLSTMPGRRSVLKSQTATKASSGSSTHIESGELNNFDDIASSRPVPLTALSARTGSRNKGSKNWRPFAFDDASEDTADDSEENSSVTFPETTRPKIRSRLSESVSYKADNEDSSIGDVSTEHGTVSRPYERERPLDARGEPKRSAWPRDLDPQIQQNPLSYSTGYGRPLGRPRNPNLLNSESYALWPPPVPDDNFPINGIQHEHYLFHNNHTMPGSIYQVQEPSVYDVPRYRVLSRRYHRDPIDAQYAPMLHYSMSQPEYGKFAGYDSVPPKNVLLGTTRSVSNNIDGSSFVQEAPSRTVMPASSSRLVSDPTGASTLAMADPSSHTTGSGKPEKTVEERKLALKNAVLKKIVQDEQELSEKIERERKRVLEQEKEEKNLEQKLKHNSGPSCEEKKSIALSDRSSGSLQDSIPAAAILSGSDHSSAEAEGVKERESARKRKELRDAVLTKVEEDRRQHEQRINDGQGQSLRVRHGQDIREPPTHSSNVGNPSPESPGIIHADVAVKDELPDETAGINVTPQPTIAIERTPRSPPGLPRPIYHNPTALSRALDDCHTSKHKSKYTRVREANDWFHRDARGEDECRQQVMEIANKYILESDQMGDDVYTKEDKDVAKQMTLLIGNVVANLKTYMTDKKDEHPDYFANFEPVHPRFCATDTGDIRSYFEGPTRVQSNSSPGRSRIAVGRKVLVSRSSKSLANDR